MSRFYNYAKRFDELARSRFGDYKKVVAEYEAAKSAYEHHPYRHAVGIVRAEDAESLAEAKLKMIRAETKLNAAKIDLEEGKNQLREIQKELNEEVDRYYRINPDDVNMAALEILKSGMLRPEEYGKMIEDNKNNPTMCRMIGQYAQQAYSDAQDRVAKWHILKAIDYSRQLDGSVHKQTFEGFCTIYDKVVKNPGLFDCWDEITTSVATF